MASSERFWKILIMAVLGIAAFTTLIILISQDRRNLSNNNSDNTNKSYQNNLPPKGGNTSVTNAKTATNSNGNVNQAATNNNTSDLNSNNYFPPDVNSNSDANKDRERSDEPHVNDVIRSYSVEALETIVRVNGEEIEKGWKRSGFGKKFTIEIMPVGRAKVEFTCEKIQFSARKGEEAEFTNDVIGKTIKLLKGVVSILANCRSKTEIVAGNKTFRPNGTLYTVAYFPDEIDKSKDKTMLIVFEKSVSVENNSTINSQSPAKTANDSQFMIFSENKIGSFEDNKAYTFRDYNYDQMKEVYEAFEMKKWIPQVLEFYEEKRGTKTDFDDNKKQFPLPSPIASPAELKWEGTSIISKHIIIENPIETPLNLNFAPPCIRQKNAESCEDSDSEWKRTGNGLRYKFEGDAGIFNIDVNKKCRAFTREKNCHIILDYEPKKIIDLTDLKLIFNHNAEKDGKLEILLNFKILPLAKFEVEPSSLFSFKELAVGETASESTDITVDGKVKIAQTDILNAAGKASDNYSIKENTCKENSLLKAGDKCQIVVEFAPKTEGEHEEKLIIRNENGGRQIVELLGKGIKPDKTTVKISPDEFRFLPQLINTESSVKEFIVTVDGPNPVEIGKVAFENSENYRIDDKCSGKIIDNSSSCSIGVFFAPQKIKMQEGLLKLPIKILSMNRKVVLAEETKSVELSGILINKPELILSEDKLCFERQKVYKGKSTNTIPNKALILSNTGTVPVRINELKIKENLGDFLINRSETTCGVLLNTGESCRIVIGFTPRKRKVREETLQIFSNAGDKPTEVRLSGFGKPRNPILRFYYKHLKKYKLKPCA